MSHRKDFKVMSNVPEKVYSEYRKKLIERGYRTFGTGSYITKKNSEIFIKGIKEWIKDGE